MQKSNKPTRRSATHVGTTRRIFLIVWLLVSIFLLTGAASAVAGCLCGNGCTGVCPVWEQAKLQARKISAEAKLAAFMADQKEAKRRYLRVTWLDLQRNVRLEGFVPSASVAEKVTRLVIETVEGSYEVKTNLLAIPGLGQSPARGTYVSEAVLDSLLSGRVCHTIKAPGVHYLLDHLGAEIITWDVFEGEVTFYVVLGSKDVPEEKLAVTLQHHLRDIPGLKRLKYHVLHPRSP